ncbi:FecR domain-containing protein [Chitinophaga pendula]|uniref:FecR family protein n=1 Tax=Chitinophaga TaxID=79328 RepID=UPI000BAEC89A|nr:MULTISPECIES: FecR family protein [Chitinophaga]ASZ13363.1 iron dicitrate transport regulator FecR [Chitinophaga sp. MD30]UCJ09015.1 FecR domain-containing protein [Chitinophaga pendula]
MIDKQHLLTLLEKYEAGRCSPEELQQLEDWYARLGGDLPEEVLVPGSAAASLHTAQQLTILKQRLAGERKGERRLPVRRVMQWAAVFIGLILAAGIIYYLLAATFLQRHGAVEIVQSSYSRYITLPDGSRVVLRAGSRLSYPPAFTGSIREVRLSGEAYFDIKPDSARGFVIHTGRVRTTVLGTSFNIKAYPDAEEITVSVTRGKVRVEDDKQVLAVLTRDQQVVYNTLRSLSARQVVTAATQLDWTREDMIFESISFDDIATILHKRYSVSIRFANEGLRHCLIRASFTGTESLAEVLDVICGVRNASYKIDGQEVLIDGQPCDTP